MKRAILAALTLLAATVATGCHQLNHAGSPAHGCQSCGKHAASGHAHHLAGGHEFGGHGAPNGLHPGRDVHGAYYGEYAKRRPGHPDYIPKLPAHYGQQVQTGPPGPPAPAYAYPYYTVRGPRDFLVNNPPSVGR